MRDRRSLRDTIGALLAVRPDLAGRLRDGGRVGLIGTGACAGAAQIRDYLDGLLDQAIERIASPGPVLPILRFDVVVTVDALGEASDALGFLAAIRNSLTPSGAYLLVDHAPLALGLTARAGFALIRALSAPGQTDAFLLQR